MSGSRNGSVPATSGAVGTGYRILVVSQHFFPETFRINDVVKLLNCRGHAVDVLTAQPNYPGGAIFAGYSAASFRIDDWEGAKMFRIPIVPRGRGGSFRLALNYASFVCSACCFAPWMLRGRKYDLVFVYASSPVLQAIAAIEIAWVKRLPLVVWVQDLWPESISATGHVRSKLVLWIVRRVVRWIYARCELILVQSPGFLSHVGKLADKNRLRVLPNLAESVFEVRAEGEAGDRSSSGFVVTFAGNIGAAQSIETIIDAAEMLRGSDDILIRIVGAGSRLEFLRQEVRMRDLRNVELVGRREIDEMPQLLSQSDALLVSLRADPIFDLTVPSKLQAYLAIGRPIIAGLSGEGARVVVEAGAGIVCTPGNAAEMARAIRSTAELSISERERMGERGRRYYSENFSSEIVLSELEAMLHEIVVKEAS